MNFVFNSLRKGLVFDCSLRLKSTTRGVSLAADSDMEAGGVASWPAAAGGVITKQGGAAQGTQCLRVAWGGSANPYAYQLNKFIPSQPIRCTGWARSDGVAVPHVLLYYTAWTGTTSTQWQRIDAYYANPPGSTFALRSVINAPGYCEFDDVTLWEATQNLIDRVGGLNVRAYYSPVYDGYTSFNGIGYAYTRNGNFNPAGTKTIAFNMNPSAIGTTSVMVYMAETVLAPNDGIAIGTSGSKILASTRPSLLGSLGSTPTLSNGTWYRVVVEKGTSVVNKIWIDGVDYSTPAWTAYGLANSLTMFGASYSGGVTLKHTGLLSDVKVWNRSLSADEIAADFAFHGK